MSQKNRVSVLILLFVFISSLSFSKDTPEINFNGALRFNYNYFDWIKDSKKTGGTFGYDVFIINPNGTYKDFVFDVDYRFYTTSSGGRMLKHGWMGYNISPQHQLQVGLNHIPFGVMPANSNNFYFSINYYVGLEADADMGLKYLYNNNKWDIAVAFYKNSDVLNFNSSEGISASRYGVDLAGRNKEVNQGNVRVAYQLVSGGNKHDLGLSAQLGGLYNIDTKEMGSHKAFALHYEGNIHNWNIKAQYSAYRISPRNAEDESREYVEAAAYGDIYQITTKADTYTTSVSYTIPFKKGIVDALTFYNDFGWINKKSKEMYDSYQNVTGMHITMGPLFCYVDYMLAKNHAWLGGDGQTAFAKGLKDEDWKISFNFNIGYYF